MEITTVNTNTGVCESRTATRRRTSSFLKLIIAFSLKPPSKLELLKREVSNVPAAKVPQKQEHQLLVAFRDSKTSLLKLLKDMVKKSNRI